MLQVTLINHTPEPEKTVAAAARLCYSPRGAVEIMDDFTPEKVDKFLARLTQMGHFPLRNMSVSPLPLKASAGPYPTSWSGTASPPIPRNPSGM